MLTVSRICGSGVQSIVTAAQMIQLGEAATVVAGGMENMSQAPHVLRGMRDTFRLGRPPQAGTELPKDMEDYLFTNLVDGVSGMFMAQTSDELCRRKGVVREEADEYAAMSHQRTESSVSSGIWQDEVVSVETPEGVIGHSHEDHVVLGTTIETLSGLRTHFGPDSLVTAGNASGVVDGAAAVEVECVEQRAEGISGGRRGGGGRPDAGAAGRVPQARGDAAADEGDEDEGDEGDGDR